MATDEIVKGYLKAFGSDDFLVYPIYMRRAMETDYAVFIKNEIANITGWPLYRCDVHTPAVDFLLEGIARIKKNCYELRASDGR